MAKTCNGCGERKAPETISYFEHESDMARMERHLKRSWITNIILIFLLVGMFIGFWVYESQFETVETVEEIVVDADENGIANYIGNDGDIINGESDGKENN